jgi:hypothetical protein
VAGNSFVGTWLSDPGQKMGTYRVKFDSNGAIDLSGPQVAATGTYVVRGNVAVATYKKQRMGDPKKTPGFEFTLAPNKMALTFTPRPSAPAKMNLHRQQ